MRPLFVFVAAARRYAMPLVPMATFAMAVIIKGHRW
jgi:hypothetical protein